MRAMLSWYESSSRLWAGSSTQGAGNGDGAATGGELAPTRMAVPEAGFALEIFNCLNIVSR